MRENLVKGDKIYLSIINLFSGDAASARNELVTKRSKYRQFHRFFRFGTNLIYNSK